MYSLNFQFGCAYTCTLIKVLYIEYHLVYFVRTNIPATSHSCGNIHDGCFAYAAMCLLQCIRFLPCIINPVYLHYHTFPRRAERTSGRHNTKLPRYRFSSTLSTLTLRVVKSHRKGYSATVSILRWTWPLWEIYGVEGTTRKYDNFMLIFSYGNTSLYHASILDPEA